MGETIELLKVKRETSEHKAPLLKGLTSWDVVVRRSERRCRKGGGVTGAVFVGRR